jgi:hypothetical protein
MCFDPRERDEIGVGLRDDFEVRDENRSGPVAKDLVGLIVDVCWTDDRGEFPGRNLGLDYMNNLRSGGLSSRDKRSSESKSHQPKWAMAARAPKAVLLLSVKPYRDSPTEVPCRQDPRSHNKALPALSNSPLRGRCSNRLGHGNLI